MKPWSDMAHPRYLPPATPPRESPLQLLAGCVGLLLVIFALAWLLPVMGS